MGDPEPDGGDPVVRRFMKPLHQKQPHQINHLQPSSHRHRIEASHCSAFLTGLGTTFQRLTAFRWGLEGVGCPA